MNALHTISQTLLKLKARSCHRMIAHEGFRPSGNVDDFDMDFAVLKLDSPVDFNQCDKSYETLLE